MLNCRKQKTTILWVVEGDLKLMFFYCCYFPHTLLFATYDHCWLLISIVPVASCGVQLDTFFMVWLCLWMVLMDLIKLLDREENKRRRNKETSRFYFWD